MLPYHDRLAFSQASESELALVQARIEAERHLRRIAQARKTLASLSEETHAVRQQVSETAHTCHTLLSATRRGETV
ncbi:MAG: hypothetical protein AAFR04_15365 [Pseudomonadota bacterium]